MDIILVAAVAENGVIGRDGGLPWRLPSDLKRFKADTLGKPVVMGRKTWEGLGKPLPGRLNIVVTHRTGYHAEGAEVTGSLDDALRLAEIRGRCMAGADAICVIGGGEIFAEALPVADRLHITHVLAGPDGDTRFPPIDAAVWRPLRSEAHPADGTDSHDTRYVVYGRRR